MLGFAGIVQSGNRGTPLLLDTYSGAAAAYSLRKLRTAYTGSAVRVRRSTDSVEQDIGFDANGNLDETTLQTFCGENLLQRSEEFDNAYWSGKFGTVTITANAAVSPNGNNTAYRYQSIGTSTYWSNINLYNPLNYTISIYAKAVTPGSKNKFRLTPSSGTGISSDFTATDTWQRFSVNFNCTLNAGFAITRPTTESDVDIYIWGAQINTTSLKPYVQTTTAARDGMGYVTKWYDQSGNARDAAQTTAANQPRIVNAGVVEKVNGKAACYFDGSNDYFQGISKASNTDETYILAIKTNSNSIDQRVFGNPISNAYRLRINGTGSFQFIDYYNADTSIASISSDTSYSLIFCHTQSKKTIIYKNGVKGTDGITLQQTIMNSTSETDIKLGADRNGTSPFIGYLSEFIMYATDKSIIRTDLQTNINTYYSIY